MLQLVGGIAVAGAVAAGTTAFTAAGFTNTIGSPVVVGGSLSPSIVGASLEGLTFDYNPNSSEVIGMTVRMLGSGGTLPVGSRVTVASVGTKSAPNEFYCDPSVADTGSGFQKAVCVFGTDASTQAGNITAMSSLTLTVQGPATV
ncbi:hypothetical protein [Paractinoplanes hotanensis]|uniref:Uncharacterized protein n=1 Tax=Paractinoplanes hotanensis TaxID=2906497 RepID=A0ABT0XT77_9ACTN|nr:hypothetical protein [Actinoplanes hotanensis]MCM4076972.1 hypothetical protein [Actinoplanes hotanensis]